MGEDNDEQRPGFDYWMSHRGQGNYFDNEFNIDGTRKSINGYYTTVVTDHAVQWIERQHAEAVAARRSAQGAAWRADPAGARFENAFDNFPSDAGQLRRVPRRRGKPAWLEQSLDTWHGAEGPLYGLKEYDTFVRTYLATLLSVDDSVGRIYDALRASGQLDDTAIVFTSDNGFVLGEHGRVDKRTMYEESIRVPLLVRYPRLVKAGTVVSQMVLSHDLAPS